VSKAWKSLSDEERTLWEEKARQDKARFHVEKSHYTGPWRVPKKKRSNLDIRTPKRPMSAFLAFSHTHRAEAKRNYPDFSNNQITRLLAKRWKDAPDDEKKKFIDQEFELRQKYLENIAAWRQSQKHELLTQRQIREEMALKEVADRVKETTDEDVECCHANYDQLSYDYYPIVQNPNWSSYPYRYHDDISQIPNYDSRYAYNAETSANIRGGHHDSNTNQPTLHPPSTTDHYLYPQHAYPHFYYSSHYSGLHGSRSYEGMPYYYPPERISSDCQHRIDEYHGKLCKDNDLNDVSKLYLNHPRKS
jgi:hypothetical protein